MTIVLFLVGLLVGSGIVAGLLIPRMRGAVRSAAAAGEAERAARTLLAAATDRHGAELEATHAQAQRDAEHAEQIAAERDAAHERQLAELRAATEEKIALVSGN